jgi:hypothetical protein
LPFMLKRISPAPTSICAPTVLRKVAQEWAAILLLFPCLAPWSRWGRSNLGFSPECLLLSPPGSEPRNRPARAASASVIGAWSLIGQIQPWASR